MKQLIIAAMCFVLVSTCNARTITEIEKEIKDLRNEYTQLQQTPIFIWGTKQQNLSEKQKCGTAAYNINIAQGKEWKLYKTKRVVTLNPQYVCAIHKAIYKTDRCPVQPGCKSETSIGTANFCNLGTKYNLSYATWKVLKERIPASEVQEARLKEIEETIFELRAEQAKLLKQQGVKQNPKGVKQNPKSKGKEKTNKTSKLNQKANQKTNEM